MRQNLTLKNRLADADVADSHPKVYTSFHITYEFKEEDNLDKSKVEREIKLSQNEYCSVSAMLKNAGPVTFEIKYI